jgi:hypothetical protein
LNLPDVSRSDETKSLSRETILKAKSALIDLGPKTTRGTAMWAIVSFIYREYCRARLAEMRKYHLAS